VTQRGQPDDVVGPRGSLGAELSGWILYGGRTERLVTELRSSGPRWNANGVLTSSPGLAREGGATPGNKAPTGPNPNGVGLGLESLFGACDAHAATPLGLDFTHAGDPG